MVEIEPPITNERLTDQKPFVIRGHHLSEFVCFVKDTVTPQKKAKNMRAGIERLKNISSPSNFGYTPCERKRNLEYTQDVIGTTAESADRYEKNIRDVFERFVSLPDDHSVELTEEMPDDMCKACVVGQHCHKVTFPTKKGIDSWNIDNFLRDIRPLNLPKPVIVKEQIHLTNSKPVRVRRVRTTLGTVKKVLKEGSLSFG